MPPVFPAREWSLVLCSRTGLRSHGAERPRRTGMNHGCGEGPLTQHPMLASGRQDMAGRPHPRPCPGLPLRTAKCGGAGCALWGLLARSACRVVCLSRGLCSRNPS